MPKIIFKFPCTMEIQIEKKDFEELMKGTDNNTKMRCPMHGSRCHRKISLERDTQKSKKEGPIYINN